MPDGSTKVFLCLDCQSSLTHEKLPRFALKNDLYRGRLPEEFADLSWVEEMVCSIYRNTAHVTHLYNSSDPCQPRVFHSNTCAHDMNVLSVADTLPRSPADLNGMLSVVFVRRANLYLSKLGTLFHIRKAKAWSFLCWLSSNNKLYQNVTIDRSIMDLYPENGILLGLEDGIIHDSDTDPKHSFQQETTGLSEHPVENLSAPAPDSTDHWQPFVEKMGVSDPECDRIPDRKFTACALRNIATAAA
ncbi:hypothetical protein JB92DRAFT_3278850 [Gautieria morchelliformis]|nr:hypothetical protein JB92DRAFT_3278850 [Gautieria morchelliformis]